MFVVRSGRVRISRQVRGGHKTFAILGPGEFFGEMAIINGEPRNASAEALEDAKVIELDARQVEELVAGDVEIAVRLVLKLTRRLAEADSLISVLTKRDPRTRVILGLLREAERIGRASGSAEAVVVKRDLDELCDEIGVKRAELDEVVTRMIRVGIVKPLADGLEVGSAKRLSEFLSFLEERGIVHE